jgi:GDP-4-dehydro-6-deoxy-D-mannose reductase
MAVWLVTGGSGFVGHHVLKALRNGRQPASADARIVALGRRCPDGCPKADFVSADLGDLANLRQAVAKVSPDFVIHTAGKTPPATNEELFQANFWATVHLLDAVRSLEKPVRMVLSGSAAELGAVEPSDSPVDEEYRCDPIDAYGRSKWMATIRGLAERPPMQVMVGRIFNVIGPGTPPSQAFGRFAERLGEPGEDPLDLNVGDLDALRDFIDVRDVADALIAIATRGTAGRVYHIATGHARPVREGLDRLVSLSGRTVKLRFDPAVATRRGPAVSHAKIARITTETGWTPTVPWEQSLTDLWNVAQR